MCSTSETKDAIARRAHLRVWLWAMGVCETAEKATVCLASPVSSQTQAISAPRCVVRNQAELTLLLNGIDLVATRPRRQHRVNP